VDPRSRCLRGVHIATVGTRRVSRTGHSARLAEPTVERHSQPVVWSNTLALALIAGDALTGTHFGGDDLDVTNAVQVAQPRDVVWFKRGEPDCASGTSSIAAQKFGRGERTRPRGTYVIGQHGRACAVPSPCATCHRARRESRDAERSKARPQTRACAAGAARRPLRRRLAAHGSPGAPDGRRARQVRTSRYRLPPVARSSAAWPLVSRGSFGSMTPRFLTIRKLPFCAWAMYMLRRT